MDQARFLEACRWALSGEGAPQGIGTLGEKALHRAVKYYFQPDSRTCGRCRCGPFVADALVDPRAAWWRCRPAPCTAAAAPSWRPFLVPGAGDRGVPRPREKDRGVDLPAEGEVTPAHGKALSSPRRAQVLPELYRLAGAAGPPRVLRLCVLLLEVEEYRLLNGWSRDKKRGSTRFEQAAGLPAGGGVGALPPGEYGKLLPPGACPPLFTSRELGTRGGGAPPKRASSAAHVLRKGGGDFRQEGKAGQRLSCMPGRDRA